MVSFNTIPSNVRKPLFYIEIDGSLAGTYSQNHRILLIGNRLSGGSVDALTPERISSTAQATAYFGPGSVLALMAETAFANNDSSEIWAVAVDDNEASTAATGSLSIAGQATAAGTLNVYVGGKAIRVGVASGDAATGIATKLAAAINANLNLPVTASATDAIVSLTAKNKGTVGNEVSIDLNLLGYFGGEVLPEGITVAITPMAGGTSAPDMADVIAAIGDEDFEYIVLPYTDTASLDAFQTFLDGRWAYNKQQYGHLFAARKGTYSELATFGGTRNDKHASVIGFNGSPTPAYQWAAALGAIAGRELERDPARPLQALEMKGITAPTTAKRWTYNETSVLLNAGIATFYVANGKVYLERSITTYQKNDYGVTDNAFLDVETLATLARINREMRYRITTKFPRHKLASDGTRFGAGQAIVTPNIIKAEIIAAYEALERLGIVENAKAFAKSMIVEIDDNDRNRVNVVMNPDLVNQFRVFAAKNQFVL